MPRQTVLLAWELGGGMGHVTTLARLARRLQALDVRLVAAVKVPAAAKMLSILGIEIIQAPPWPSASLSAAQIARSSSRTMGDILATAGLADAAGLTRLLQAWDELLLRLEPDLVIADLAPAAALAARARVPLIQVGNGFTLPPAEMLRFPSLHALQPPEFDETETLAIVNAVLASRGQTRLDWLPQLFSADARMVLTFPSLDPYRTQRPSPADGPVFEQMPRASEPGDGSIFAYLSRGYPLHPDLVRALQASAPKLHIHAADLPDADAKTLKQAGATVASEPVVAADALAGASLVIHFGGSGLAAEALAAGVPQLILSMQIEQQLNGAALQRAGVGRVISAYDPGARIPAGTIGDLLQDAVVARRAAEVGREHREWLQGRDVLARLVAESRRLLLT